VDHNRAMRRNERGVILDWLLKVGIWLALISIVLFDAGAIVVNAISLDSTANDLAIQMSTGVGEGRAETDKEITDYAENLATENGVKLVKASVDEEGVLRIRIRRTAETLVVSKIGFIEDWAVATADGKSDVR
jgi:hypothetical protein